MHPTKSSVPNLEAPVVNATELSSQSPKPEGSFVECVRFSDVNGKPKNVQPTSLVSASRPELQDGAPLHAARLPYSGEQKLREDTKFAPEQRKATPKIPVKETVTRLMARKKEQQASNGLDAFLSLLDSVRKE